MLLPLAAGKDERLAGDPTGVVGGVEHGDPGDVVRAAERRLRLHRFAEVTCGDARGMKPLEPGRKALTCARRKGGSLLAAHHCRLYGKSTVADHDNLKRMRGNSQPCRTE